MRITWLAGRTDLIGIRDDLPLHALHACLTVTKGPKETSPGWVPGQFDVRTDAGMRYLSALVYDVDGSTEAQRDAVLQRLRDYHLSAHVGSSYSDGTKGEDLFCYRIVMELDRELTPAEYRHVYPLVANVILRDTPYDTQCSNPSRFYYYRHVADTGVAWSVLTEGKPIKVDTYLAQPAAAPVSSGTVIAGSEVPWERHSDYDLRTRLVATCKGKPREPLWNCLRAVASGVQAWNVQDHPNQVDGLPTSGDKWITTELLWQWAHTDGWHRVHPDDIGTLVAPSLALLAKHDAERGNDTYQPSDIARKWVRAAEKAETAHWLETEGGKIQQKIEEMAREDEDTSWARKLQVTKQGPKSTLFNACVLFDHHPRLQGCLAYEERKGEVVVVHDLPWRKGSAGGVWEEHDATEGVIWIGDEVGYSATKSDVHEAAITAAKRVTYDAFKRYLDGLTWDGVQRVATWLCMYAGAQDTPFHRAAGERWLVSAVARTYQPGAKVDTCLVLEGPQGAKKSTLLNVLAGDKHFLDHLPDIDSKDGQMQLHGPVIIELAEMTSFGKKDVEKIKSFMSTRIDHYRRPYERVTSATPRRCIFAGTLNPDGTGYLRDSTGARRFWCVEVGACNPEALSGVRDQVWAEARDLYLAGEPWWLTDAEDSAAREVSDQRREVDSWETIIGDVLERPAHPAEGMPRHGTVQMGTGVTTGAGGRVMTVTTSALLSAMGDSRQDRASQSRVGRIMRRLGWEKARLGGNWIFRRPGA